MMALRNMMAAAANRSPWINWSGALDGSSSTFTTNSTLLTALTKLDTDKVMVVYQDVTNSNYGTACVGTVSDTTISWGTPVVFSSSAIDNSAVVALSATQAIVTYVDTGDTNKGKSVILDVSGTVITVGSIVTFESNAIDAVSVAKLSVTKAIVAYNGATPKGKSMVLDVSGSTITTNTAFAFNGSSTATNVTISDISATQAIIVYKDSGNSSYGTAQVLDIASSTITGNTEYVFNSFTSTLFKIARLSSTSFVTVYKDVGDSSFSSVQALSVAGTVVSSGIKQRVVNLSTSEDYIAITRADSRSAFIFFRNVSTSQGAARVASVTGTEITLQTVVVVRASTCSAMALTALDDRRVLYTFRDQSDSSKGKSQVSKV